MKSQTVWERIYNLPFVFVFYTFKIVKYYEYTEYTRWQMWYFWNKRQAVEESTNWTVAIFFLRHMIQHVVPRWQDMSSNLGWVTDEYLLVLFVLFFIRTKLLFSCISQNIHTHPPPHPGILGKSNPGNILEQP